MNVPVVLRIFLLTIFPICLLDQIVVAADRPDDTLSTNILSPPESETPRINGPRVFGMRPGSPFLYLIPVTGRRPLEYAVDGLPAGLKLDTATGMITGTLTAAGEHKSWKDGKIQRGERDTFVKWTLGAAQATGAAFIDLNEAVAREYERLGPDTVEKLFADKNTHSTPAGAELNARFLVAGLRALPADPLDRSLSDKGRQVPPLVTFIVAGKP